MLRVLGQTSTNPSGRRDVVWPVRQNTQMLGQPASPKIFRFTEIRKRRMYRRNPAQGRGAYRDRHERGPGGGGRRSHRREWFRRAESRERRRRAHDRCDRRTAKSCRPGARSLCAKSCGDVCCPTGPRASAIRRATGAIVHRSPGRARHKPFQPLRMGRPDVGLHLYAAVQFCYDNFAQWTAGASRHPVFPALSFI
ncbi:hypothetical protein ACVWWR_008129 [Bradyrhizobium sp. LM3.2]